MLLTEKNKPKPIIVNGDLITIYQIDVWVHFCENVMIINNLEAHIKSIVSSIGTVFISLHA